MKRAALGVALGLVLLIATLLYRATRFTSRQIAAPPYAPVVLDTAGATARLAGALQFRTISYDESVSPSGAEFTRFHEYLRTRFPKLHARLKREVTNGFSLLYTWQGSDTSLAPILLMAHQDVVPVEAESTWTYPPFAGHVADGYVWGRGALDDKGNLMAILEAIEQLVALDVAPRRTIYLAFGHDEEVGGRNGATQTAALLASRGVHLQFVLDEGGAITTGLVPGIASPVALVGIAEKGYVSLELTAHAQGGHSSMPPPGTAIGILGEAVTELEEDQMPRRISGATAAMLDYIGPEMAFSRRVALGNRWLLSSLIERQFGATPSGNAMLRTTTAPTILAAGVKDNVLPSTARAVVNFRILPGDSIAGVVAHATEAIDDPRVTIRVIPESAVEPSPVSPDTSESFLTMERTLRQVAPGVIVTPWLVVGGTDSRHFDKLTANVYRSGALTLTAADLGRIHGTNERVAISDYARNIAFYIQLIRNSAL
ncbi:MAG TPA: M20 family peptidase [Gemmatimonadales bacterium]|jgi:carboxypeptidase PM20D1|nr:M20 family peptidase [Gemmatimonadales bacterium]